MVDGFGREITYARVSLTDLCNYRCVYCMDDCGIEKKPHGEMLRSEEFLTVIRALSELGVEKVRFTGGEPLVKKGALELIEQVSEISNLKTLALTTNGSLLSDCAARLAAAGVQNVNISIDSLNSEKYRRITRRGNLEDALNGLRSAKAAGLNVKVNAVLLKGVNDCEILDFARFAKEEDVCVRFIELMPFECQNGFAQKYFLPLAEVLKAHPEFKEIGNRGSTNAVYYALPDGSELGFISAVSRKFCEFCNRVRITADGKLLNCLHENKEYDLKLYLNNFEGLKKYISECVAKKPAGHRLSDGDRQSRCMQRIGG